MRQLVSVIVLFGFLFCCVLLNAGSAFFPREFNGIVSVQSLPIAQSTLKEYYFDDTITTENAGYTPFSAGIGMSFAFLYGYVRALPKFIFETSIGGDGEGFWGYGGELSFEAHPLLDWKYDPYLYCNFGYVDLPGGGYDGQGYHLDVGGGLIYGLLPTIKVAPFVGYTPINKWRRRRQVGYMMVDPIIGPEPAYEGRTCTHSGIRCGISILYNIFGN